MDHDEGGQSNRKADKRRHGSRDPLQNGHESRGDYDGRNRDSSSLGRRTLDAHADRSSAEDNDYRDRGSRDEGERNGRRGRRRRSTEGTDRHYNKDPYDADYPQRYNDRDDYGYNDRNKGRDDYRYNDRDNNRYNGRDNYRDNDRDDYRYNDRDNNRDDYRYNDRDNNRYNDRDNNRYNDRDDYRYNDRDNNRSNDRDNYRYNDTYKYPNPNRYNPEPITPPPYTPHDHEKPHPPNSPPEYRDSTPGMEIDFDSVINSSKDSPGKKPVYRNAVGALKKLFKRKSEDVQHHGKETPSQSQGSLTEVDVVVVSDAKGLIYGQDENEERGNWTGRFDFILSMLGYAVGLGNVWRFPYLCYRNGGGAFLFPFLLMMVVIGLPLFYLEASLGQFSSCGAMTCWEFSPIFKGVGIAMVIVSALTGIYYNMILGWSLHYLFSSFTSDLPWTSCTNHWNTEDCKLLHPAIACDQQDQKKALDGTCQDENGLGIGLWNQTLFTLVTNRKLISPSEQYWNKHVLDFSKSIGDFGQPKWDLVLCLLLAWTICFLCLIKGIKTTGKVVYFTAIFPYVVLVILFFRGVTLDNAYLGIRYFITPKFERLLDANVWKDAANQIFFSMSIAGGGLITLSSYNRFHNNILRDSLIVAIGDSVTCVLGGFVIFSFLGYMAGKLGVDIEEVAADGAGLAFVVYPEAVSSLPPSTLWALLFFFMLLTLGLDSQFAMIETVLSGVLDQCPHLRPKKTLVILVICCILFILGLPLTCPGGMYLLQLMDNYVGGLSLIILGFVELVAVIFVYGGRRFCQDIHLMTGSTRFLFWQVTWYALSPLTISFIFVFMFVDYKRSTYGDDYTYPVWADVLGWMFTLSSILAIPITMIYRVVKEWEGDNAWQKFRLLSLPSVYWGPALAKHRKLVNYVPDFQIDPYQGLKPRDRAAYVNPGFSADLDISQNGRTTASASHASLAASNASLSSHRVAMISISSNVSSPRLQRHKVHPPSLTPSAGVISYESNV